MCRRTSINSAGPSHAPPPSRSPVPPGAYLVRVATHGVAGAAARDPVLAKGLTTLSGKLVSRPIAEAHGLPYQDPGHPAASGPGGVGNSLALASRAE
jgi:hypothetical protein